jgi:hypothetical protein
MQRRLKIDIFTERFLKGALGIAAELILVFVMILVGFLVCLVWWEVFL